MVTTWDGTRVFASVSVAVGVAMAMAYLGDQGADGTPEHWHFRRTMALWVLVVAMMPAVVSEFGGTSFRTGWLDPAEVVIQKLHLPDPGSSNRSPLRAPTSARDERIAP